MLCVVDEVIYSCDRIGGDGIVGHIDITYIEYLVVINVVKKRTD